MSTTVANERVEAYFFNIGQGNCTGIAKLTPAGNHYWIIDAGSNPNPSKVLDLSNAYNYNQVQMAHAITNWIQNPLSINIIITHFNEDYYNLIPSIVNQFRNPNNNVTYVTKVRFFTNPMKEGELFEMGFDPLSSATHIEINKNDIRYWSWEGERLFSIMGAYPKEEVTFLNFNQFNDSGNNLVVKFKYEGSSILIPGDATPQTYDSLKDLESTIFLLNPNGSSDAPNSLSYLEKIKPEYIVCSSRHLSSHNHPTSTTIEETRKYFANLANKKEGSYFSKIAGKTSIMENYHFFASNLIQDFFNLGLSRKNQVDYDSNFAPVMSLVQKDISTVQAKTIYITNYPFFHTGTNGTICFQFVKSLSKIQIKTFDFDEKLNLAETTQAHLFSKNQMIETLKIFFEFWNKNFSPVALNLIGEKPEFKSKDFEGFGNEFQVLNLRNSGILELTKNNLSDILSMFPFVTKIALNSDQIQDGAVEEDACAARLLDMDF